MRVEFLGGRRDPDGQFRQKLASGGLSWPRDRSETLCKHGWKLGARFSGPGTILDPLRPIFTDLGADRQMPAIETGQMSANETGQMSAVEAGQMSSVETGQMSVVEIGQMSAVEAGQMSAVETRQM